MKKTNREVHKAIKIWAFMGFAPRGSPLGKARFSCKDNLLNWNFKGLEKGWPPKVVRLYHIPESTSSTFTNGQVCSSDWKVHPMLVILRKSRATPAYLGLLHNKTLHTDFLWVWQTFLKHTLYARYESELLELESQGWPSMIFPFWLRVAF